MQRKLLFKSTFIICTFIINLNFFFTSANAQWIQQFAPTTSNLLDVKFLNKQTGWTCGYYGTILKTTNGGNNWYSQNSNIYGKSLQCLNIIDSNILYSVGGFETIIKTTNGGQNWLIIKDDQVGSGHSYYSSYFINQNTGWICGSGSIIFKTTNGGNSFDSSAIPVGYLYDIFFRNSNEGLVCGEAATMFRTTNGGLNWNQIIVPVGTQASNFLEFSFINNNTGFIVGFGNNKLYKTTNFGLSWDSVSRAQSYDNSYTLFFVNELTGWIAGSAGFLRKTTNGGLNWWQENVLQFGNGGFGDLYFYNDTIGWAVGTLGKILYTESGGQMLSINNNTNKISNKFILYQNYPNPFNSETKIEFEIIENNFYKLIIYDLLGRKVEEILNRKLEKGNYNISYIANLCSGIYFYTLESDKVNFKRKFVIIK